MARKKKKKKMNRRVVKDKKFKGIPRAYLSGTKGAKRSQIQESNNCSNQIHSTKN